MQDQHASLANEGDAGEAIVSGHEDLSRTENDSHSEQTYPAQLNASVKHGWRSRKTPSRPDFWVSRKWAIVLVLALACWSFYVVVGRICTPMIRQQSSSGLGLPVGVGILIGYVIVWLLMVGTYLKMVVTGPGIATTHVPKSAHPEPTDFRMENFGISNLSSSQGSDPAEAPQISELAPIGNLIHDTLVTHRPSSDFGTEAPLKGSKVKDWRTVERPLPPLPPPVRWCQYCEIVKPPRTHHCRHCGVCILQFDHHCLWIGQCVGWGNHKFFIIFTFWGAIFCIYTFVFLVVSSTKSSNTDGQVVAMIVLSALFGLFTLSMYLSHIHLIVTGRTTVESFASRDQHDAESRVLQQEYGYFFHNSERRKVQKKWKEEWGNTPVDARWIFGTKMEMWEQEMGKSRLGWILPIGRPLGDGIHYESNRRFGPNGEWLKKKDWPKDLQI